MNTHFFKEKGYLKIEDLIKKGELEYYLNIYNDFINNKIGDSRFRSDLSGDNGSSEKITQIMVPSRSYPMLLDSYLYKRCFEIAKKLEGQDMELDFDMLINKPPNSYRETPWHQDAAYWIDMPDKRALSIWVALEPSTLENGCMWFVPGSNKHELRKHTFAVEGGPLQCECDEKEGIPIPLNPGSCTVHDGRTLHYSRGNSTDSSRKAIILNFRPKEMIELERSKGFDHTGVREVRG